MAKGSLSGVRKGKKGDSVYYKIAGSNNKDKQGERQYIGEVTNPKTDAQIEQRMKMTPAVNFYRALKEDVLDHSFQGVKYGARSHSEFMKLAMLQPLETLPYVAKGDITLYPAPYIISKGSLADIKVVGHNEDVIASTLNLQFIATLSDNDTFETFVEKMLASNFTLLKGDQLTFIVITEDEGFTKKSVSRLVLDKNKYPANETWLNVLDSLGLWIDTNGWKFLDEFNFNKFAAAVIVSRPNAAKTNGAVSWLRSTTQLYVAPAWMATFQTQAKYDEAVNSYKTKGGSPTSDWYLNDGTLG